MTDRQRDFGDFILPFQVEELGVRGRLVRLEKTVQDLIGEGRYPDDVSVLLATTTALSATLASGLKYDGIFTLQAQGNGPVSLLLADVTSGGDIRGYANYDAANLPGPDDAGAMVPRLLGAGHLAFTVDQGMKSDRYQGITELSGGTLADCAQTYFRDSEQLETAVLLDAQSDNKGFLRAGAFMVQKMPDQSVDLKIWEDSQEPWREAAILAASLKTSELLDPALPAEDLLFRLFHERGVRVFECKPVRHACRCSRKRIENMLVSFPEAEIDAMKKNNVISVTCEFCDLVYIFDETDLCALFA